MSNIINFANRQLCEYAHIFPNVVALLDHLLFTIGNGYSFNEATGMIVGRGGKRIDEYPALTPEDWESLIRACHKYEDDSELRVRLDLPQEYIDGRKSVYKVQNVQESDFSEEALYQNIKAMAAERKSDEFDMDDGFVRPYPLSEDFSDIYSINKNTPKWFLQIALNLCNAWVRFLNEELESGHVWTPPKPKNFKPERAAFLSNALGELIASLDEGNIEPKTTDYSDATWTAKHRDMLSERAAVIEVLLGSK
jgi:hypothetical protein